MIRKRWAKSFQQIRNLELMLTDREVPLLIQFTGRWYPAVAHHLIRQAGIDAPYVLTPLEETQPKWLNPPPFRHPTPAAHKVYARRICSAMAQVLGWERLQDFAAQVHYRKSEEAWDGKATNLMHFLAEKQAAGHHGAFRDVVYDPHPFLNEATGLMGPRTVLLLRPSEGPGRVEITVRPVPGQPAVYPLHLTATIPSSSGGTTKQVVIPGDGPRVQRLALEVPSDVPPDALVDLFLQTDQAQALSGPTPARSLVLDGIRIVAGIDR